ncbi:enoyl-CoA hydratase-related protein, partial [Acinetobacter baumannii]
IAAVLPPSLEVALEGEVAIVRLTRPEKRNALNDRTVLGLQAFFSNLPEGIKAVILHGAGDHFSAGLDLSEVTERDTTEG